MLCACVLWGKLRMTVLQDSFNAVLFLCLWRNSSSKHEGRKPLLSICYSHDIMNVEDNEWLIFKWYSGLSICAALDIAISISFSILFCKSSLDKNLNTMYPIECSKCRDVAQFGRALPWGGRGRMFNSCRSDHFFLQFFRYL